MERGKTTIKSGPMGTDQGYAIKDSNSGKKAEGKEVNFVHKQTIHRENIKNEKKFESKNFKYEYTFSPYSSKLYHYIVYPFAEKPVHVRPSTTGTLMTKQEDRREILINNDPISTHPIK